MLKNTSVVAENRETAAVEARPVADNETGRAPIRPPRIWDPRRKVVINRRYQMRMSLMTVSLALCLLIPLNVAFFVARTNDSAAILGETPELATMLDAQDRLATTLVFIGSAIFLVIVFFSTLIVSHKTAGAAYQLVLRLGDVEQGKYDTQVKLRDGDNLGELEKAFNDMVFSLQDRTWREIEALEVLMESAGKVSDRAGAEELRGCLEGMVQQQRRLVGG